MIELVQLTKRYGDIVAVDALSIAVEPGELVVLLGASGCGKTTTLKMVNRLVEPDGGTVRLDGEDVRSVPAHALRRQIGYCFQRIGLFPHMTVAENVGITPRLLGWDVAAIELRVDELLELVELEPASIRSRFPHELSGGQQQRVAVARAIAARPRILLLDEPFGALDPLTRERLQRSFQRIRRELGLTALFVTHDMVEALLLGDRIAVLDGGRVVRLGTPAELLHDPGNAYVAELMATPTRQAEAIEALLHAGER